MTTHIVTASTGKPHVTSSDDGALHAAVSGEGRYLLNSGDRLKVSMSDSNTLTIATGALMMDGRFIRVDSPETVKIANGAQGTYRKDLVVLHYRRDVADNGYESVTWEVAQGTAASTAANAKAPSIVTGNILNGDTDARVAVAEVDLAGLSPTPKLLLKKLDSLSDIAAYVKQNTCNLWPIGFLYAGTTVDRAESDDPGVALLLMSKETFRRVRGRDFDASKDVVVGMNGDYAANPYLSGLTVYYSPASGNIWARFSGVSAGTQVRVNWLIASAS